MQDRLDFGFGFKTKVGGVGLMEKFPTITSAMLEAIGEYKEEAKHSPAPQSPVPCEQRSVNLIQALYIIEQFWSSHNCTTKGSWILFENEDGTYEAKPYAEICVEPKGMYEREFIKIDFEVKEG